MLKTLIKFTLLTAAFVTVAACQQKVQEFKKYATEADVPRMSLADVKKAYDAGLAVIIDSRAEAAFKAEHIAGAINIPYGEQDKMMDRVPKGKKLIVYCS